LQPDLERAPIANTAGSPASSPEALDRRRALGSTGGKERALSDVWYNTAAWVQAIGTIGAVLGSAWLAKRESRAARQREADARLAAKTGALNLAIMAHTQVRNLGRLLRDESRLGRLNHISPSRGLVANQNMLTSFPIQTLEDAEAMSAFSYFPSLLSMAAEIYGHLEEAVRAAEEDNPHEIFAHYAEQLAMIEEFADERLEVLKLALNLPASAAAGAAAQPPSAERHVSHSARVTQRAETAQA
jgi:hypothetical protein